MNYGEWEAGMPETITRDPLWSVTAYRLAVFLGDVAWHDVTRLVKDRRTQGLADQLYEAVGSISANLAEGYSRGGAKDRAQFYEYSLGSARESRDWYHKSRHVLGDEVVNHRMALIVEIIRLLLTMIPDQRGHVVKEAPALYQVRSVAGSEGTTAGLLAHVPLPDP
jgi:four helix bundle protein